MGKVSVSYLFSLLKYQTKCVIIFLFRQLMTSQRSEIYLPEGKMEIQKFEYLQNEKHFLDEIKSIFHSF